ncbi:unnamed protein product [Acanthoscelides obtectus]|uniref:Uncharacterized protein n=1 Tax=Acanthoscelides obtectus TaxID=200917 RepID=A0A9P0PLE7_ACAOB|nr:unnamed protein product [Acanthoscelides obtectus]CAK1630898.1 hypothetical protein AOBTE_LOCUS6625 [Acanthoscelides obtectus]
MIAVNLACEVHYVGGLRGRVTQLNKIWRSIPLTILMKILTIPVIQTLLSLAVKSTILCLRKILVAPGILGVREILRMVVTVMVELEVTLMVEVTIIARHLDKIWCGS